MRSDGQTIGFAARESQTKAGLAPGRSTSHGGGQHPATCGQLTSHWRSFGARAGRRNQLQAPDRAYPTDTESQDRHLE